MYLLQMITDYGYDGCDTDNVCVSETIEKLHEIQDIIKDEFIIRDQEFTKLGEAHNVEWLPLRVTPHHRSPEEITVWQNKVSKLQNSYPTITKCGINSARYEIGRTEFHISEVEVI